MIPGEQITIENIDNLVKRHMPFIIRTTSNLTGQYVSVENDGEFSIALSAFVESVEKYNPERGNFLSFAKLVIESRLKTYLRKEKERPEAESLDALYESGQDFSEDTFGERNSLNEEILQYKTELFKFGLTLETLADEAPKHKDTKENAIEIARKAADDEETVIQTYHKKKLPVRAVARVAGVTEKIVKGSKHFILASMLIFVKKFPGLMEFVSGTRCKDVL